MNTSPNIQFRFSGHETFPCRYAWLPKVVQYVPRESSLFADESRAMVKLGVGKNMVRAIRFWAEVTDVIQHDNKGGWQVTQFGDQILGYEGHDPYLESLQTLWLLHWKIASRSSDPLFAWHFLLNYWHRAEFSRTEILRVLSDEIQRIGKKISTVTIDQHFSTFLHTYVPTRSVKQTVLEDNLDCPLVELNLITQVGERPVPDSGRREPLFSFRVADKAEISPQLFAYCVNDFWVKRRPNEMTLTFRDVAVAEGSPGQIFKLPERDVRDRLERIKSDSDGAFDFRDSVATQQIVKLFEPKSDKLLDNLYGSLAPHE